MRVGGSVAAERLRLMDEVRWRRGEGVVWRRSADRVLLLPSAAPDVLLLDGIGAVIWLLLDDVATTEELVAQVGGIDGAPAHDDASAEVAAFLTELEAVGALERSVR